jgi:hypothetical protein
MKYTFAATAIVLATAAANAATSTITTPSGRYLWQGDIFIIQSNSLCSGDGSTVGKFAQAIFAPKGLPGNNSKQDQLMLFQDLSAEQWVPPSASTTGLLSGTKTVVATGIDSGGLYTKTKSASLTVSQPAPTPTKVGDSIVKITFTMTKTDGCVFTAAGSLAGPF